MTARLELRGTGTVQALSAKLAWDPAVVRVASAAPGELCDGLGVIMLSGRPGVIDVARFGVGAGLAGKGTIANVTFERIGPGDPRIELESVDARNAANDHVVMSFRSVDTPRVPAATSFTRIAPNPMRGTTTLSFGLARSGAIDLAIYSVEGGLVRQLVRGVREAGTYQITWDGRDEGGAQAAAGVYFVRLVTPQGRFHRSLVYLK